MLFRIALFLALSSSMAFATTNSPAAAAPGTVTPEQNTPSWEQPEDDTDQANEPAQPAQPKQDDDKPINDNDDYLDDPTIGNDEPAEPAQPKKNQDNYRGGDGKQGNGQQQQGKKRPRGPRQLEETIRVQQPVYGMARLPLYMLLGSKIEQFQGYRLMNVIVNGYSQYGQGLAFFCSTLCGQPQNVGGFFNSYPVQTNGEPMNPYSSQWFLEFRGNFVVDSLVLQFEH